MINLENIITSLPMQATEGSNNTFKVERKNLIEVLSHLNKEGFDLLADLTAIDYSTKVVVVYVLQSFDEPTRIIIKVDLEKEDTKIPSIVQLWQSADWMEREVFDMFGVFFENHPQLETILLPEDVQGKAPLRKDFITQSSRR